MKYALSAGFLVVALLGAIWLCSARGPATLHSAQTSADPYVPLRLYDGNWGLETAGKSATPMYISNHCEKTGLFYVCEQMVNGKIEDLLIFLPSGSSGSTLLYKTLAVTASAERPGDWGNLEITGDWWVYSNSAKDNGTVTYWRTTNSFAGPDKIHFEVQKSMDGKTWETKQTGDEHRVAK